MDKNEYAFFICNQAVNLALKIIFFSIFSFNGTWVTLPCKNYATLLRNICRIGPKLRHVVCTLRNQIL